MSFLKDSDIYLRVFMNCKAQQLFPHIQSLVVVVFDSRFYYTFSP